MPSFEYEATSYGNFGVRRPVGALVSGERGDNIDELNGCGGNEVKAWLRSRGATAMQGVEHQLNPTKAATGRRTPRC